MGLLHSGDVADLAYYNRAERGWAACPVIKEMCGIVKIWRFRDEVLVLASERLKSHTNGRSMINRAGYFTTKCKKIRNDKIEYLHCEVSIGNGTIQSRPFSETNQSGSSSSRHKLPSCTHSQVVARLHGSTPWKPQRVAQLRGESKGGSCREVCQALGLTRPHQPVTRNEYKPHKKHRETQNDDVETGCGSHSRSIRFGPNTLQKQSQNS